MIAPSAEEIAKKHAILHLQKHFGPDFTEAEEEAAVEAFVACAEEYASFLRGLLVRAIAAGSESNMLATEAVATLLELGDPALNPPSMGDSEAALRERIETLETLVSTNRMKQIEDNMVAETLRTDAVVLKSQLADLHTQNEFLRGKVEMLENA